jgi:hypothetical protein
VRVGDGTVEQFLEQIRQDRRAGPYRPQPVLRVYSPKPHGGQRPLGMPPVRDWVVPQACKLVVEPIFEADCQNTAYGFRPHRSPAALAPGGSTPQRSAGDAADPAGAQSGSGGTGPMAADRGGVCARWGAYTSYKVAKRVIEFSTSIPRTALRPQYGAGFLGAPLQTVRPSDTPTLQEQGDRRGTSSLTTHPNARGSRHV